ncbi:MAG TPA: hypothetical protein VGQ96_00605, partial [Candidatus Eremiobacteraceae bacterium]|nr:hypothetical protein [Candidatus Eremiobacteraceae bacterium]
MVPRPWKEAFSMVNRQIDAMAELQNAFSVVFKNWVLAVPTALVSAIAAILAFFVLAASFAPLMAGGMMPDTSDPTAALAMFRTALPAFAVFLIVVVLLGLVAQAVVIGGAEHVWHGQPPDLSGGLSKAFGKVPTLIGLFIVAIVVGAICGLLTIALFLGPIIGLVLLFFFMYALPAIVIGNEGVFGALGSSWRLVSKNVGPSLIAFVGIVVINVIGGIVELLFSHIPVLNIVVNLVVGGLVAAYAALVVV